MGRNLFIVTRAHGSQALLINGMHGWRLPEIETPNVHKWWRETQVVNQSIHTKYGLTVVVLRCVLIFHPSNCAARTAVFLVENQDEDSIALQGTWIAEQDLAQREFSDPRHRTILQGAMASLPDGNKVELLPWERRGWFAQATAWIAEEAARHGHRLTGPIVQVRNHGYMSCVLRAPTARGALYMKACPPVWAQEPDLTAELAERHSHILPTVIAVNLENHWLLTEEFEGRKLKMLPDNGRYLRLWEQLLTAFGRVQVEYAHDQARLIQLGCPNWGLEHLSTYINEFFLHVVPTIAVEGTVSWSSAQLQRVARCLEERCSRLARYNIPDTLHHGDFHSGNILTDGTSCRVIDWAFQAGVAHPFFFMSVVFEEHVDGAIRSHLRDQYLTLWTEFEPLDRLVEAFDLAQPLSLLHEVMGHSLQLDSARMPWEMTVEKEAFAYYLDELIKSVDA